MHTFEHNQVIFQHHGDYSGEVHIHDTHDDIVMRIPAASLIAFAAEFVRRKKIQELESATDREIFGLKVKT